MDLKRASRISEDANPFDFSQLENSLNAIVSELSDPDEDLDLEPWMLPEVVEGVAKLINSSSTFRSPAGLKNSSCGLHDCTNSLCKVGTLTPVGTLGPSIWKDTPVFPTMYNDFTDGIFPVEWSLPTTVSPKKLMDSLISSCSSSRRSSTSFRRAASSSRENWTCEEGKEMFGALCPQRLQSPLKGSHIPVYIKPPDSYRQKQRIVSTGVSYSNLILCSPPPSCSKHRATRAYWKHLGGQFAPECTQLLTQEKQNGEKLSFSEVVASNAKSTSPLSSKLSVSVREEDW